MLFEGRFLSKLLSSQKQYIDIYVFHNHTFMCFLVKLRLLTIM